jgi:hypothetical protein
MGFWTLLVRVSVDFLLNLYLPAIPYKVQSLFEKKTYVLEDFMYLTSAEHDPRPGVYGNFPTP